MPQVLHIIINDYSYECGDGCCTNFGTTVTVNGVQLPLENQDTATIVQQVLEHLGYEANVEQIYDDYD